MKTKAVWLFYGALALVIMGPMLARGYVLTLDTVFTPKLPAPTGLSNLYLWQWLVHGLNFVVPSQVIEKLIIFLILFLGGVGMHKLVGDRLKTKPKPSSQNPPPAISPYFAGLLYVVNPFTYERWMAGHFLFLAGYALLPWLLRAVFNFVASPGRKTSLRLALWYTAIALLSVHVLALGALAGTIVVGLYAAARPPAANYRQRLFGYSAVSVASGLILNAYWLSGVVTGSSPISRTLGNITDKDLAAFTTASGQRGGVLLNVLGLHGFWLERFPRYFVPDKNLALWLLGFSVLGVVITAGVRWQWKAAKKPALGLLLIGLVGFVVACGVNAPLFGGINRWLINNVPLARGFREPQKFGALLALAYCYFAGLGAQRLFDKARLLGVHWRELAPAVLLVVPLLYTPTMLFGFAGQLKAVSYPASWYDFNNQLKRQPPDGRILFLPWHEYMSYDFSPRIIANPAPNFFTADVIAGTNAEFGGIDDPLPTPTSRYVVNQVLARAHQPGIGDRLARINVQYVLLSDGYGYQNYKFLDHQPQLSKIKSSPGLAVYLNLEYGR